MAGHSQFKNIMHRKGAQDAKRAKVFTKLLREITVAARQGGGDAETNPRLRTVLTTARQANMPKDNIERAIKKATEGTDGDQYEALRYEGFGPEGIAILVEVLTDNRNRSAPEVRTLFNKNHGRWAEPNSVAFMFQNLGCLTYPLTSDHEAISLTAIDHGAIDFETDEKEKTFSIFCPKEAFFSLRDPLEQQFGSPTEAQLIWRPDLWIEVKEPEPLLDLIEALQDHDDVQHVWSNAKINSWD
jgi:YebC/PmpR family DNA-binding regulatory protein